MIKMAHTLFIEATRLDKVLQKDLVELRDAFGRDVCVSRVSAIVAMKMKGLSST